MTRSRQLLSLCALLSLAAPATAGLKTTFKPFSRGVGHAWGPRARTRPGYLPGYGSVPGTRSPKGGLVRAFTRRTVRVFFGPKLYRLLSSRSRRNDRVEQFKKRWVYETSNNFLRTVEVDVSDSGALLTSYNGGFYEGLAQGRGTWAEWNSDKGVAEMRSANVEVYDTDVDYEDVDAVIEQVQSYYLNDGYHVPLIGVNRRSDGKLRLVTKLPGREIHPLQVDTRHLAPGDRPRLREDLRQIVKTFPRTWSKRIVVLLGSDGQIDFFTRGGPPNLGTQFLERANSDDAEGEPIVEQSLPDGYDSIQPERIRRASPEIHHLLYEPALPAAPVSNGT